MPCPHDEKRLAAKLIADERRPAPRRLDLSDNLSHFDTVEGDVIGHGTLLCHLGGPSGSLLALVQSDAHPLPVFGSHPVSRYETGRLLHHWEDIGIEVFRSLVLPPGLNAYLPDNSVHRDL